MVYQDIILISNDIRSILDTSRQSHLAAINAALAARRAGNVKGFEAVAGEVKAFSLLLTTAMHEMSVHILAVSQAVSNLYRQRHSLRNHEGAYERSQNSGLVAVLTHAKARQRNLNAVLLEQVQRLAYQVVLALRLCLTGRNLARAAMVEAAYGGEATGMLKNVASDIETTIDAIQVRLKAIHQRIR
jgi:hypothetical protein